MQRDVYLDAVDVKDSGITPATDRSIAIFNRALDNAHRPILGPWFTTTWEGESGRCSQRRPGKRHIAYVTCQDIPGSPSLFGACVEGGAWERG